MDELAERGFVPGMSKEEQDNLAKSETLAIRISNIANMLLFAAKVYASVTSGSLAIVASTLDSLLDLLSGFILWFTALLYANTKPVSVSHWQEKDATTGNPSICISDGHTWIANHLGISSDNVIQSQGVQPNKRARELGGWDHALCYIGQTASCSLLQIVQ
ncbi:unnamed protein product [Brassica oleracea]